MEGGLKADTIRLKKHVRVDGPVQGNELIKAKHVSLSEPFSSPLNLPLADITPALPTFQPGSQAVTVGKKKIETLPPGSYGSVLLKKGSHHHPTTLTLEGGIYDFLELELRKHSRLICLDTCQIQIKQRLSSNQHVTIGPKPGAELSAKDVKIFVDGHNGAGSTVHDQPKAAKLGRDNMIIAHIVVPHGTFWLRRQSTMRGVVVARWIILGQKVKATVEDPLGSPAQDGGMPDGSLDGPKDSGPSDAAQDTANDAPSDTAADAPTDSAPDAPTDTFLPVDLMQPDTCIPTTCAAQGKNCGSLPDNCGGTLDCGICTAPETCGGAGEPNLCGCTLTTCTAQDKNCGSIPDNCGSTLSCGICTAPETCGGAGEANVCGCTPTTCAAEGKNCDTISDGCGGVLDCGICAPPDACGGAGEANVCGCTPTTCVAQGANCGTIADNCGGALDCGTCVSPQSCGGGGIPNICGCVPTTCAAEGKNCGTIPDNCGGVLDCGFCAPPNTCGGTGLPNTCGCLPTTCAAEGKNCGTIEDSCGGLLNCGDCTSPETCGGAGEDNVCGGCVPTTCAAEGKECGTIPDGCGLELSCGGCPSGQGCGWGGVPSICGSTPPDPSTIAPATDLTISTTLFDSTAFLYSGDSPVQSGVVPGTIKRRRAALVRGRVLDIQGNPIASVGVEILNHPELGQTATRDDGRYDLVVNGGDVLVLSFQRAGFLPVQRHVRAPWQSAKGVEDVVMIGLDPQVTTVTSLATQMQVARGSAVTDSDGTRQGTLLFPSGTAGTLELPDGSAVTLDTMNVRATEYTVGDAGPAAMPGSLPTNVAYTYAVEYSVDEATAVGATKVSFNMPVISYTENFLGFPVGIAVPVGSYDRQRGIWVPEDSGLVVQIVSITGGMAELDLTGDGLAATPAELDALGVTAAEREQLASLYTVGQSLWRVPVNHFSPWDLNWAPYYPPDSTSPRVSYFPPNPMDDDDCEQSGSTIDCNSQILGESVPIAGTPYSLTYRSNRVPGRGNAVRFKIEPPGSFEYTHTTIKIEVAGQVHRDWMIVNDNFYYSYTWDGKDAFGRTVQGKQWMTITVRHSFRGYYRITGAFGLSGGGLPLEDVESREPVSREGSFRVLVGSWDARSQVGLGGWTFSANHPYDTEGYTQHFGYGGQRSGVDGIPSVLTTFAGMLDYSGGDGGPALDAGFYGLLSVKADGAGNILLLDNSRVRRIGTDGIITTVAGIVPTQGQDDGEFYDTFGFGGDGGPATEALLNYPYSLTVDRDGNLYIADTWNSRVRKVDTNGIIDTIAGTGDMVSAGDEGPALDASFGFLRDVEVDDHGNIYLIDENRVRKIGPDGVIHTIAGQANADFAGDGGPAVFAFLSWPRDLALDSVGNLYIADTGNRRVRMIDAEGLIHTVAGNGAGGVSGDGGLATQAELAGPVSLAVDQDDNLYIADFNNNRVRKVSAKGVISTVAGNGDYYYAGDGSPATGSGLVPESLTVDDSGFLYVAAEGRIYQSKYALPDFSNEANVVFAIASPGGGLLHEYSSSGRHLTSKSTLTGAALLAFGYTASGLLSSVTDANGNATQILRNGSGVPSAIVGPYGQTTTLALDANGYLASVTDPAGHSTSFTYGDTGLMASMTSPRGLTTAFTFDEHGRLTRDADPAGGFKELTQTLTGYDYSFENTVEVSTAEGQTTRYETTSFDDGSKAKETTFPSGLTTRVLIGTDSTVMARYADNTLLSTSSSPDPRFGLQSSFTKSRILTTPGGLSNEISSTRTAEIQDPADLLSLITQTDTLTVNGKTFTSTYDAASRQFTTTSPAGRQAAVEIDDQGRVVQLSTPGFAPVVYAYDARGRLATITEGTGAEARTLTMAYNALGQLQSITDPLSREVAFTYDLAGRITQQNLPGGRIVSYNYDMNGNLIALTPPGKTAHLFDYTTVDQGASYTPPDLGTGVTPTLYTYDRDRRLTQVTRPDTTTIDLAYSSAGQIDTLTMPRGEVTFRHDPDTGKLEQITSPDGITLGYEYDGSLLTRTSWTGAVAGYISRVYDNDLRITSRSVNDASAVSFSYDDDGMLTQAGSLSITRDAASGFISGTTLGSVNSDQTYSGFGELASIAVSYSSADLFSTTYTRDALGRITQLEEDVEGAVHIHDYTYDDAGRLTEVRLDGTLISTYTYDANGNRRRFENDLGYIADGEYDAQDRLVAYGSTIYTYTVNGDLATRTAGSEVTQYTYDALGNLTTVTLPDSTSIEYLIDGQNRRVGKKVNGALTKGWLYKDMLNPLAELDASNNVVVRFVYGSRLHVPDYLEKDGATYRIITDHLGSVRLVVDVATGVVAQRMEYDEFGVVLEDTKAPCKNKLTN